MNRVNVNTSHKAGRRTQIMSENFSDLADTVNNKLIDKMIHSEKKKEHLVEILNDIDLALNKADVLTLGPQLQTIINSITAATNELQDYITGLEKQGR
jgi:cellobiose-specific phosphotransferase system component IIB